MAACDKNTDLDNLAEQGYTISVTYDANGGEYLNRPGITVMDVFNPDHFEKDVNGNIHIPLKEPTDPSRPTSSSTSITLKKDGYFFAGWYEERTVKTIDGTPIDENGRALQLQEDGTYKYLDATTEETKLTVTPAYEYDGYWDFANTWDLNPDEIEGTESKTLYAGWVKYFEFNYYYYQQDDAETVEDESGWTLFGSHGFDYKTTNATGSQTADKDTIWLPRWNNGIMDHEFSYANQSVYTFPKLSGMTFAKAYLDADCSQEITESAFEHRGELDYEHAVAVNRVENIYVTFEQGERYKIETAKQLQDNFNAQGIYEIKANLDFTGLTWPIGFMSNSFTGKMFATEGQTFEIANISATYASADKASFVGLFGEISDGAEIRNLSFKNVTVDFAVAQLASEANVGFFAGYVQENATISGVSIDGRMKLGNVASIYSDYAFHLYANGSVEGLVAGAVVLELYGQQVFDIYNYTIIPSSVVLNADKSITLEISSSFVESNEPKYEF